MPILAVVIIAFVAFGIGILATPGALILCIEISDWRDRRKPRCPNCDVQIGYGASTLQKCRRCRAEGCTNCLWVGGEGYCQECWRTATGWKCLQCGATGPTKDLAGSLLDHPRSRVILTFDTTYSKQTQ